MERSKMEKVVKDLAKRENFNGINNNELERIKEYTQNLLEVSQQERKPYNTIDFYQNMFDRLKEHLGPRLLRRRNTPMELSRSPTPVRERTQTRVRRRRSSSPMELSLRQPQNRQINSSRYRSPSPVRQRTQMRSRSPSPVQQITQMHTTRRRSVDFRTPSPQGGKKTRKYRK